MFSLLHYTSILRLLFYVLVLQMLQLTFFLQIFFNLITKKIRLISFLFPSKIFQITLQASQMTVCFVKDVMQLAKKWLNMVVKQPFYQSLGQFFCDSLHCCLDPFHVWLHESKHGILSMLKFPDMFYVSAWHNITCRV